MCRSGILMARRQSARNYHCHRRQNAWTPTRTRQFCRTRQDPRLDGPVCQQASTNVARHPQYRNRHYRICRRRCHLAAHPPSFRLGVFRGSTGGRCRHESAGQIVWREDDDLGNLGGVQAHDSQYRDCQFDAYRRRYPLSFGTYGRLPHPNPQRPRLSARLYARLLARQVPLEFGRRQVFDTMDG